MPDGDELEAHLDLVDAGPSLHGVRHWVADHLTALPGELVEDVVLVVHELVCNAFDHAEGPRDLILRRDGAVLRVEVTDGSPKDLPVPGRSRLRETRGRGLLLVARISRGWGVELRRGRKTTWAEVDLPVRT